MAPFKICSADVELLESEVSKPSPLRIIKRSQTVAGSLSSRETFRGGRQSSSCSSLQSKGSPPMGADRPLTVRKKRQGGGTSLNVGSDHRSWDKENEQPFSATSVSADDDPDITPKARQRVPRTISAGNFLKSEFHRRSLETDQGRYSVRSNRNSFYSNQIAQHVPSPPNFGKFKPPKIPDRQPSKSKNFILRALAGRGSEESNHPQRVNSKGSRNTLVRRLSRNKTMDSDRSGRTSMSGETLYSIPMEELDLGNGGSDASTSQQETPIRALPQVPTVPQTSASPQELSQRQDVLVLSPLILSPRIKVTPETTSLPTTTSTFWVAIEIRGELHAADGRYDMHPGRRTCSSQSADIRLQDLSRYGKMYAMNISILPPSGCTVLDIIGDLHFDLEPCETRFILAKVQVGGVDSNPSPSTRDPEILMTELQNHLGDTITPYLTVQANYKHSGYTRWESNYATREGTYVHSSFHYTEAKVAIKRHDPQSAWSPRTSETITTAPQSNVFNDLIKRRLSANKAAEAFRVIYRDQPKLSSSIRKPNVNRGTGDLPPTAFETDTSSVELGFDPQVRRTRPNGVPASRTLERSVVNPSPRHRRMRYGIDEEDDGEDPARKIWASIRETSGGNRLRRHPRQSISADHYTSLETNNSPGRIGSSQSSDGVLLNQTCESPDSSIEEERTKIKEIALKNKRSVGTETLRSIAPSVSKSGKGKQGSTGLGLRVGGWGWGNFFG
ncbi:uncharacterized protein LY89DRAFT_73338 [Mollisia scopiformis]|uniref:Uncharacterized protein n=1 Tax=Mollisia scopiformis TaxID=149040 RepID=A0A194XAJ1_MOLSC|nr:uncharacterized protein LY89DRAFT_73338 [Mollisia scopiformis]KUJ17181.1 hypothetical protein LY89DRAFT_73338 [Mollisia scopiformis]